ncbi:ethanolamine utilization protein EutH [Holdemanella biformis]|uniref:ethanolamine utilization protein EutH n=1 Tax=Holdemanella biformis TaxID=1735 RepID=UPI001C26E4B3|nr:ethanolamine utilization protein EutH [Holdemanella biformis]MBU9895970.1 ethanolamine utilization protein EutH [Holdemanella biformis]MBV3417041.1 ethanolamine utilization protein EutH [Holdemanella biformis]
MNPIIFILLCFAALGLFDKMLNNRLGLASSFDRGIITMGDFMMSVGGFYCIAIAFLNGHANLFENKEMIISSLLAPDLGGYSIIESMTHVDNILIFCGVLLTSTLGCLISFQLPIFLNELDKDDLNHYLKGIIYGILGLLPVLIVAGIILQIPNFIVSFLPVIIICAILIGLFFISFQTLIVVLTLFSKLVQILGYIFFFLVCLTFFFNMNFTNATLINDALRIVFQMSIIVCGSLVFCEIILRKFSNQIERIGQILNIDKYSVMGIILSFGTSIAMLPLFGKMNRKGKILNAAFSLSGAFVFGGQLGFIASVNPNSVTWFVVVKLVAGMLGLLIANLWEKKTGNCV